MKILIRSSAKKSWQIVNSAKFKLEEELHNLLYDSPDVLPLADLNPEANPIEFFIREAGLPGSGHTDLIGFDKYGKIVIVECKLAKNAEIKRKVIGQILEYAAFLWGLSYDDIDAISMRSEGKSLSELAKASMGKDFKPDEFRMGVENSLTHGDFELIIAVDKINHELERIIEYLDKSEKPGIQIRALEVRLFANGVTQILAPRLYGKARLIQASRSEKKWNWEEFIKDCESRSGKVVVKLVKSLFEFTKKNADAFRFGGGVIRGSFTYRMKKNDKMVSIFSVFTDGKIELGKKYIRREFGVTIAEHFVDDLSQIEMFDDEQLRAKELPSVLIDDVYKKKIDQELFHSVILSLKEYS